MKTRIILLLTLVSLQFAWAQDARTILDKASTAYNAAAGIEANFTISSKKANGKSTYNQDGVALMSGNKFRIELPDGITWFDGKTQWVYPKAGDEVNVSTPTGDDLAGISPAFILNMYKSGFKLNYKGEKQERGKTVYVLEMIPQKKGEITKFTLTVDKTTYLFSSVNLLSKDNSSTLMITKLKTKVNLPASTFAFDKAKYPKLDVIDLR